MKKYFAIGVCGVLVILICCDVATAKQVIPYSDIIYAITAILIAWYSFETAHMKDEISKQNKLSIMPCLTIYECDRKFWLKNTGGPALNIKTLDIKLDELAIFSFNSIIFLNKDQEVEIIPICKAGNSDYLGKGLHVFWNGLHDFKKIFLVKIHYDDLVGRKYETVMRAGQGTHEIIRIGEIMEV